MTSIPNCTLTVEDMTDAVGNIYYFRDGDQSFGTYLTNYFMTLAGFIWAAILWHSAVADGRERLRNHYVLANIIEGIAATVAGIYHQEYATDDTTAGKAAWRASMAILTLSGLFRWLAAVDLIFDEPTGELKEKVVRGSLIAVYSVATIILIAVHTPFIVGGALGGVLPVIGFFACLCYLRCTTGAAAISRATWIFGLAFAFFLIGAVVQVAGADSCGTQCPVNCPWNPPDLNHNGVFHIFQLLFIVVNGFAARILQAAETGLKA